MPENPDQQNPDWNADGTPQANQDPGGHHDEGQPVVPPAEEHDTEGRDRPPAARPRKQSPWLGGG
jgi:hypothetical protein